MKQTAAAQAKQFGYNNDYVGYVPMQGAASQSEHGLLVVNHEYTSEELMLDKKGAQDTKEAAFQQMTKALVDIEIMAHGGSVLEIRKTNGKWQVVGDSRYAPHHRRDRVRHLGSRRRPRPHEDLLRPGSRKVRGMLNNCAGGVRCKGTWLTCERTGSYFSGKLPDGHPESRQREAL